MNPPLLYRADVLERAFNEKGYNVTSSARESGISRPTIRKMLRGGHGIILTQLWEFSSFLGVEWESLFCGLNIPKSNGHQRAMGINQAL
jgi:transcriptional regulator with XRE-family HTH domain